MSDLAYRIVVNACLPAFLVSGSPVLLGRENVPRKGAGILAPTHLSHYDVPVLMGHTPRNIDFMSVVEFLGMPFVGWLFTHMNCFFLDRGRSDMKAVRTGLEKLKQGRFISMFPEGRIRDFEDSIVHGKPFKPGLARIAYLSGAPVIPCVVLGADAYKKPTAWMPLRRIQYGIIYGQPLTARTDLEERESVQELSDRLATAYVSLYQELSGKMPAFKGRSNAKIGEEGEKSGLVPSPKTLGEGEGQKESGDR
jgi:1-acyl-sn-glycerol-3-phosphate acyltransferase